MRPASVSRAPSYGTYSARPLSLSVLSMLVTVPGELEVSELVWARSLLVSEAALEQVQAKAGVA